MSIVQNSLKHCCREKDIYSNQIRINQTALFFSKVDLGSGQKITAPVIYPTPYGGRLEYVMPHGNLLIVHLKNKDKIRLMIITIL